MRPPFKVLYNQDDSAVFYNCDKPRVDPEDVDTMVDQVAEGGADVMLICPNSQTVNYPSKVWERQWDEEPFSEVNAEHIIKMREFAKHCNYVERALTRCRHKGIVPGISMRMNDMHGSCWPELFCRFYKEHPQWHLDCPPPARGMGNKAFNYAIKEVREHHFSLIRELVSDYDFEVLELDFLRMPSYFDTQHIEEHCQTMTQFIAQVRKLLQDSGENIFLIPRVAATPGGALGLGFDVRTWAEQGLVDGITVGQFLNTGWEMPIEKFRKLVGQNLAIYASTDLGAFQYEGLESVKLPLNRDLLRGFAAGYLASGADGVNLFNFFCTLETIQGNQEPDYAALAEMKDLTALRFLPRRHAITCGITQVESDLPEQLPVTMKPLHKFGRTQSRTFNMLLASEAEGQTAHLDVVYDGQVTVNDLWLYLNDQPIGKAIEINDGQKGEIQSRVASFAIPYGVICDGMNEIVVRCESTSIKIVGLEMRFDSRKS